VSADGQFILLAPTSSGGWHRKIEKVGLDGTREVVVRTFGERDLRAIWVSVDGDKVFYSESAPYKNSFALKMTSLSSGETETLFSDQQHAEWVVSDVWADRLMLIARFDENALEWSTFDLLTREMKPILGQGETRVDDLRFGASVNRYIDRTAQLSAISDGNSLNKLIQVYMFDGSRFTPIGDRNDASVVQSIAIDHSRFHLLVTLAAGVNTDAHLNAEAHVDAYASLETQRGQFVFERRFEKSKLLGLSRFGRYSILCEADEDDRCTKVSVFDWKTQDALRFSPLPDQESPPLQNGLHAH
jgi:hypothetical protein